LIYAALLGSTVPFDRLPWLALGANFNAAAFAAGFFAIARPAKLMPHLQNRASRLTSGGCDVRIPLKGWLDMPVL